MGQAVAGVAGGETGETGGTGETSSCLDINHAIGPDIDIYRCHPLGERDYQNQQFDIISGGGHGGGEDGVVEKNSSGEPWVRLQSRSAAGKCLTLLNAFPNAPDSPVMPLGERVDKMLRLLKSAGVNGVVLNDVNACYGNNAQILNTSKLRNVARNLGPSFERYGISPYISACFASPSILGNNTTSDPASPLGKTRCIH